MIVVLAEPEDTLGLCVYAELERRLGAESVLLACSGELACARFRYRDGDPLAPGSRSSRGSRSSTVELASGRCIDSSSVRALWCRLRWLAMPQFESAQPDDRDYAHMEWFALVLAWLASLPCPVLPRPSPRGLACPSWNRWEIARAAASVGLRPRGVRATTSLRRGAGPRGSAGELPTPSLAGVEVRPVRLLGTRALPSNVRVAPSVLGSAPALLLERVSHPRATAVVVGDRLLGCEVPAEVAAKLLRLVEVLDAPLLEVGLSRADGEAAVAEAWRVEDATAFVSTLTGEVVTALADHLEQAAFAPAAASRDSVGSTAPVEAPK